MNPTYGIKRPTDGGIPPAKEHRIEEYLEECPVRNLSIDIIKLIFKQLPISEFVELYRFIKSSKLKARVQFISGLEKSHPWIKSLFVARYLNSKSEEKHYKPEGGETYGEILPGSGHQFLFYNEQKDQWGFPLKTQLTEMKETFLPIHGRSILARGVYFNFPSSFCFSHKLHLFKNGNVLLHSTWSEEVEERGYPIEENPDTFRLAFYKREGDSVSCRVPTSWINRDLVAICSRFFVLTGAEIAGAEDEESEIPIKDVIIFSDEGKRLQQIHQESGIEKVAITPSHVMYQTNESLVVIESLKEKKCVKFKNAQLLLALDEKWLLLTQKVGDSSHLIVFKDFDSYSTIDWKEKRLGDFFIWEDRQTLLFQPYSDVKSTYLFNLRTSLATERTSLKSKELDSYVFFEWRSAGGRECDLIIPPSLFHLQKLYNDRFLTNYLVSSTNLLTIVKKEPLVLIQDLVLQKDYTLPCQAFCYITDCLFAILNKNQLSLYDCDGSLTLIEEIKVCKDLAAFSQIYMNYDAVNQELMIYYGDSSKLLEVVALK